MITKLVIRYQKVQERTWSNTWIIDKERTRVTTYIKQNTVNLHKILILNYITLRVHHHCTLMLVALVMLF